MIQNKHNLNEILLQAAQTAKISGQRAIEVLQENCQLSAEAFTQQLANTLAYPYLTLTQMLALQPAFDRISFSESLQNECVLLHDVSLHGNNANIFVFADIYNQRLQTWAAERIGGAFTTYLAHHADIAAYLAKQEEDTRTVQTAIGHVTLTKNEADATEELSLNMIEGDASPVIKLVRSTLYDALKAEASDIHLETAPTGLVIKYRLDGVLSQVGAISDPKLAEQVISRIKVISELDITEQRVPQDGRFRSVYRGRDVDFRVSVMPSIHGEDVVIRVLDKQTLADKASGLSLDVLGFDAASMQTMREQFTLPYGMVLVTGPTGSGKTTTLYAAISEINHGDDKIVTIEDPVEYQLAGVLQIPVNEKKGLTFARGLRSILRHDPDRIMVGEIRDAETAQIAVQSALTGHLVFTTVHANNAFDVIGRFLNMGVDPYSFVSALNIVVAQRLLRSVCHHCAEPVSPETITLPAKMQSLTIPAHATFKRGKGCGACRGTGYKGRRAVAEILLLDDELRELIANRASIRQIKELAVKKGTRFLHHAALEMAYRGETTLEEVLRVAPMV
ncbi:GspE/PulE family protein [Methylotenera sp.]|uniref:GspE/PulE family protein n=1 Tax=Methylotenera sp. TaxID=2051956 RepID=UPI00248A7449|nr:GspE/PulE family protein [Methylotenera sp.]MDI1362215.1 GspE/PulE family protein [Methylotenera sp.]